MGRIIRVLVLLAVACPALADFRVASGSLRAHLKGGIVVRTDFNSFTQPSFTELDEFDEVVALLLAENYSAAAALADPLGYDVVQFNDSDTGSVHYLLEERLAQRGLGTCAFNPRATRLLNIQSPHPIVDSDTWAEAVDMYLDLGAAFFQIAGTQRCVSPLTSPCDGTTSTCGVDAAAYPRSDVAHYTLNFFQIASGRVAADVDPLVSVSVHGYGCGSAAEEAVSSIAQISNGTSGDIPNSIATRLAIAYNDILFAPPINFSERGAGSFNRTAGEPAELQAGGCVNFSGNTNVQGRRINGALDPCSENVVLAPTPERFIHLEQQRRLRRANPDADGLSRQVTIDAFASLFPIDVWVDGDHGGSEFGSFFRPYDTVGEGASNVRAGGTIHVKAGQHFEVVTIDRRVEIRSFGGPAVIGK